LEAQAASAEAAALLADVMPGAFEGDAHALLMAVYKDPLKEWPLRIDAAKAAIRYEKPALSSVEAQVDVDVGGDFGEIEWQLVKAPAASS
jgi:hypothetical protein